MWEYVNGVAIVVGYAAIILTLLGLCFMVVVAFDDHRAAKAAFDAELEALRTPGQGRVDR